MTKEEKALFTKALKFIYLKRLEHAGFTAKIRIIFKDDDDESVDNSTSEEDVKT